MELVIFRRATPANPWEECLVSVMQWACSPGVCCGGIASLTDTRKVDDPGEVSPGTGCAVFADPEDRKDHHGISGVVAEESTSRVGTAKTQGVDLCSGRE